MRKHGLPPHETTLKDLVVYLHDKTTPVEGTSEWKPEDADIISKIIKATDDQIKQPYGEQIEPNAYIKEVPSTLKYDIAIVGNQITLTKKGGKKTQKKRNNK
jgi:hypothetical protein